MLTFALPAGPARNDGFRAAAGSEATIMEEKKTARIPDGFDPNGPGIANGSYFGLPFAPEESSLVLIPVPWDVTVSYREGSALGPGAILDASLQVDLYRRALSGCRKRGIGTARTGRYMAAA